jgi:hypothetical protein
MMGPDPTRMEAALMTAQIERLNGIQQAEIIRAG